MTKHEHKAGQRATTLQSPFVVGKVSLRFILTAAIASFVLLYVTQSIQETARAYEIRALQEEKKALEKTQARLELELVELEAFGRIEDSVLTSDDGTSGEGVSQATVEPPKWEPIGPVAHLLLPQPVAER